MSARFARDEEITTWRGDGWVLLDGLIGTDFLEATGAQIKIADGTLTIRSRQ